MSLDCRLWPTRLPPPECSLTWVDVMEWFFGVVELASVFCLFKNVPNCWFGHSFSFCCLSHRFVLFFHPDDLPRHVHWHLFGLHALSSKDQPPNAQSAFGINSRPFCLVCHGIIRKPATDYRSVSIPNIFEPLKKEVLSIRWLSFFNGNCKFFF